jgi:hypothetical protein
LALGDLAERVSTLLQKGEGPSSSLLKTTCRRNCQALMSVTVKTVTLRTLMRDPLLVKRLTRRGTTVQVTERGQPLWFIHSAQAVDSEQEQANKAAIETMFDQMLQEPVSPLSLSKIIKENRR